MAPSRRYDDDDTGTATGLLAGEGEGEGEGEREGECVGKREGECVGKREGEREGERVGVGVGKREGECEGECEGEGENTMITYKIHDWSQYGEEVAFDVEAKAPTGERCRATVTLAVADDCLVPPFPDVERWVPAELLAFFSAHADYPPCEVTDGLLDALRAVVSVDDLDLPRGCGHCAGSGEGMYDGSRCWSCRGSGTERRGGRDDDE